MQPPFKKVSFPKVKLNISQDEEGVIFLESAYDVPEYEANLVNVLIKQAEKNAQKIFLAMRNNKGEWEKISYAEALLQVFAIGQWLKDQKISEQQSILLLSGNSIEHAMLTLGGLVAGVPVCPVSSNYSLLKMYERLDYIADLVNPAVIFADDAELYAATLEHLTNEQRIMVTRTADNKQENSFSYQQLIATKVQADTRDSISILDPDAIHKFMFTSGSTGLPKAVIHTSRMQAANAAFCSAVMAKATSWADASLDWLPWNHVSGALVQTCVMHNGGTLYIDDGKPLPGQFQKSIKNIRELAVTFLINIPLAYELLADELENNAEFRKEFFSNMQHLVYGGAGISNELYQRYQKMSVAETGKRLLFGAGYGATETASGVLATYFEMEGPCVGLPQPGVKLKLVPVYNGFELRVAGPTLTPGYYKRPDLNDNLLDTDGYYSMNDIVDWVEPDTPEKGLRFIGRLSDEFKLDSGTWVNAYNLKEIIKPQISHLISEFVLCGVNRPTVAILAWPDMKLCRTLVEDDSLADAEVLIHPIIKSNIQTALANHNRDNPTGSFQISALKFLTTPPDPAKGEFTEKGTINAAAVLANRVDEVDSLYKQSDSNSPIVSNNTIDII